MVFSTRVAAIKNAAKGEMENGYQPPGNSRSLRWGLWGMERRMKRQISAIGSKRLSPDPMRVRRSKLFTS